MTARLIVALVALPLGADMLDRFIAWAARKYRREIPEGDEYPPFGWVLWTRVVHRNSDYDHDLWVVKLPFLKWDKIGGGWHEEDYQYGWVQLTLFNRRPFQRRELFAGGGWQTHWLVAR